jgi:CTP synthase
VGDIESAPFLEALRQLHLETGHKSVMFVHTTLVPIVGAVGEQKTKPTQHSVMEMRRAGIHPDMLVCRSETRLEPKVREKLALFCDVDKDAVISAPDARTIYEVPLILEEQGVADYIIKRLDLHAEGRNLEQWKTFVDHVVAPTHSCTIGVVGKYTDLADAYLSIKEAFIHAGAARDTKVMIKWIDSENVERAPDAADMLGSLDGILVPGGFGPRGAEGKIKAIQYAREKKVPYLGICFGFQLATVEFARHVLGLDKANSTEIDPRTPHPVIDLLPGHTADEAKGATMRLGASEVRVSAGTKGWGVYHQDVIFERHRHRWEVNPGYISKLESAGLKYSGKDPTGELMEILELPDHPYFVGTQFHPEFKSRPERPAPVFAGLVDAAIARAKARAHN